MGIIDLRHLARGVAVSTPVYQDVTHPHPRAAVGYVDIRRASYVIIVCEDSGEVAENPGGSWICRTCASVGNSSP